MRNAQLNKYQVNGTPFIGKPRKPCKAKKADENILDPIINGENADISPSRRRRQHPRYGKEIYYQCPYCSRIYHIVDEGEGGMVEHLAYPRKKEIDTTERVCRKCIDKVSNEDWKLEQIKKFREKHYPCGLAKDDIFDKDGNLKQEAWLNADGSEVKKCFAIASQCYHIKFPPVCPINIANIPKEKK